jgi:phosphatidate cytidylyltransferase
MPQERRPPAGRRTASGAARAPRQRPAQREAPRRARRSEPPRKPRAPRERGRGSELLLRVLVAIPGAIVVIVFVNAGGLPFVLFISAIGCICAYELYRMLHRWRPLPLVGFAAIIGLAFAGLYGGPRQVLEVAVITVPVLFLFVVARGQTHSTVAIAGTLLGVYWIGFAFAHAALLRELPHGNAVIIDVLIGTFVGDTGAYAGGRLFGRRPLAPKISPNKTVEGLFCGMLVGILAVFLAGLYQTWLTQGDALLLGVVVAVLAPIGDLFESMIKRDAGIKDAGSLFGPHGGALDRTDAALFTLVAGYYVWVAVMH